MSFDALVNNIVVLHGSLSSDPVWRELPTGSTAVTLEVTTDVDDGPRRSAPVTIIDPRRVAELEKMHAGSEVVVIGEVRRRFFRGANGPGSRTEVVAHEVVPAGQRSRVERHISEVRRVLGTLVV